MNEIRTHGPMSPALPASGNLTVGQRALRGEASTLIDPGTVRAGSAALAAAGTYARLGWSDDGRSITLSEEAEHLSRVPPAAMFEALAREIEAALNRSADDGVNRILIGLMVDAYPNARAAQPGTYADVMARDLLDLGYAPAIVAEGLQKVRRGKPFLPAISEVLTAVEETATQHRSRVRSLRVYAERRAEWVVSLRRRMAKAAAAAGAAENSTDVISPTGVDKIRDIDLSTSCTHTPTHQ